MSPNLFHYSTIVCVSFWCYSMFICLVSNGSEPNSFHLHDIYKTSWIYLLWFEHRASSMSIWAWTTTKDLEQTEKNRSNEQTNSEVRMSLSPLGHKQCNMWQHPLSNWMNFMHIQNKTNKIKLAKSSNCCVRDTVGKQKMFEFVCFFLGVEKSKSPVYSI